MGQRFDYQKAAQEPLRAMYALEKYLSGFGLDVKLLHLLKARASQFNGCAYCIDMHIKEAARRGKRSSAFTLSAPGGKTRAAGIARSANPIITSRPEAARSTWQP